MRIFTVLRSMASGLCVYVLAAACGSADRAVESALDGGRAATNGDSSSGSIGDAIAEVFADALADVTTPVKDAKADPLPPDVATEKCDKKRLFGSTETWTAEHAYPGKTAADLSSVNAMLPTPLSGFTYAVGPVFVADGLAAITCGATGNPQPTYDVKFVLH